MPIVRVIFFEKRTFFEEFVVFDFFFVFLPLIYDV